MFCGLGKLQNLGGIQDYITRNFLCIENLKLKQNLNRCLGISIHKWSFPIKAPE
jgi:hypothetical protein